MSLAMRHRPVLSAWNNLTTGGMSKSADAAAIVKSLMSAAAKSKALQAAAKRVPVGGLNAANLGRVPPKVRMMPFPGGMGQQVANANAGVRRMRMPFPGSVQQTIANAQTNAANAAWSPTGRVATPNLAGGAKDFLTKTVPAGAGKVKNYLTKPVPGLVGTGLGAATGGGLLYAGANIGQNYADARTAEALGNEAQAKIKALGDGSKTTAGAGTAKEQDSLEQVGSGIKNFATENWPALLAGGAALGAGGMWWKNRQDRKRDEEEEALLTGMHPKAAMVKLAREFPVQVGFLARCGERRLNDIEVQRAIEKCASISDGVAEDWIRFFDAAARFEAGTSSRMMKAAELPPPVPPVEEPKPAAPVKTEATSPLNTAGGGANATANAVAPKTTMPPPAPDPGGGARVSSGLASLWHGPRGLAGANTGAPPRPVPAPAPAAPVPGAPLNNTQQAMANAPSNQVIAQRQQWLADLNDASRRGDTARMKSLQANKPGMNAPAAGVAGAARPVLSPTMQAERDRLTDPVQQTADKIQAVNAAGNEAVENAQRRLVPTAADVAADQKAMAERMDQGETWEQSQGKNFSSPTNDQGVMSTAGNIGGKLATRTASGIGLGAPMAIGSDIYSGIRNGNWDFANTQSVGNDIVSPITEGLTPGNPQAQAQTQRPELGNTSFANNVVPEWSKQLKEVAESTEPQPFGKQYAAGVGSQLLDNYKLIASAPVAGGAAGLASKIPMIGPTIGSGIGMTAGTLPTVMTAGAAAINEGGLQSVDPETGLTGRQTEAQQRGILAAQTGAGNYSPNMVPPNATPGQQQEWMDSAVNGGIRAMNAKLTAAGKPEMNPQQVQEYTAQQTAKLEPVFKQQNEARAAANIPGMSQDGKTFDPMGQIKLPEGFNASNTRSFMTPEMTSHVEAMQHQDMKTFGDLTQKLPPEMQQHLQSGAPATPQEMEAMKQAGIDPNMVKATAQRIATSGPLMDSVQRWNGDMNKAFQAAGTPESMQAAFKSNPTLADAAQKDAASSGGDIMSSLSKMWTNLGPMGQMLVGIGLPVALFGMMNSVMGEGGMGSVMMGLLGGGAAALGLNQAGMLPQGVSDMINPVLSQLGLGGLASTAGETGAPNTAAGAADAAGAGTAGAGTAPAGGTAPGGAASALGINLKDPAARAKLRAAPPAEQSAALKGMMKQDPTLKGKLQRASWGLWAGKDKEVLEGVRSAVGDPSVSLDDVKAMVATYDRG